MIVQGAYLYQVHIPDDLLNVVIVDIVISNIQSDGVLCCDRGLLCSTA